VGIQDDTDRNTLDNCLTVVATINLEKKAMVTGANQRSMRYRGHIFHGFQ
jgi:hypothetical protein